MDSAIHKNTGKEYLGPLIWKPGLFENKDVHKEKWLCPQEEIENIDEITEEIYVTPVIEHRRKNTFIPSFFRLLPRYSDKVKLVQESDEHKKAKTVVSTLLTEDFNFQLEYENDIYLVKDLPIDYKKIQEHIRKREVTKSNILTKQKKRADVLIPFVFNSYFGNGIAIEIRISEKEEKIEEKEDFWFQRGYSIIWMDETDFEQIDGRWGIKGNKLQIIPFSIGYNKILNNREQEMRSYLFNMHEIKNDIDKIFEKKRRQLEDEKINLEANILDDANALVDEAKTILHTFENKSMKTCRTCKYGNKNTKDDDGTIVCWYGTRWGKGKAMGYNRYPSKHEPLDGCGHHEHC
jgi:hypothetical protein